MHSISKHISLSEATTKIGIKIDLSATKMLPDDSSFWQYFCGYFWRRDSNDSGVIENVDFQGFRTLRLRHHMNEANIITQYYFVNCRLSTDPCIYMTLNDLEKLEWPLYVKFSLLRTALSAIRLHTYCRVCLHTWPAETCGCAEADRYPRNIWNQKANFFPGANCRSGFQH